jgi:hypothetical protein
LGILEERLRRLLNATDASICVEGTVATTSRGIRRAFFPHPLARNPVLEGSMNVTPCRYGHVQLGIAGSRHVQSPHESFPHGSRTSPPANTQMAHPDFARN